MGSFQENLIELPDVSHVKCINLYDMRTNELYGTIRNQTGQQGSLRVYYFLFTQSPRLNSEAAERALGLFAEHTAHAIEHPGSHPNIDRLLLIKAGKLELKIKVEFEE